MALEARRDQAERHTVTVLATLVTLASPAFQARCGGSSSALAQSTHTIGKAQGATTSLPKDAEHSAQHVSSGDVGCDVELLAALRRAPTELWRLVAGSTTTNLVTAWPGMTDRDLQELLNESTDEVAVIDLAGAVVDVIPPSLPLAPHRHADGTSRSAHQGALCIHRSGKTIRNGFIRLGGRRTRICRSYKFIRHRKIGLVVDAPGCVLDRVTLVPLGVGGDCSVLVQKRGQLTLESCTVGGGTQSQITVVGGGKSRACVAASRSVLHLPLSVEDGGALTLRGCLVAPATEREFLVHVTGAHSSLRAHQTRFVPHGTAGVGVGVAQEPTAMPGPPCVARPPSYRGAPHPYPWPNDLALLTGLTGRHPTQAGWVAAFPMTLRAPAPVCTWPAVSPGMVVLVPNGAPFATAPRWTAGVDAPARLPPWAPAGRLVSPAVPGPCVPAALVHRPVAAPCTAPQEAPSQGVTILAGAAAVLEDCQLVQAGGPCVQVRGKGSHVLVRRSVLVGKGGAPEMAMTGDAGRGGGVHAGGGSKAVLEEVRVMRVVGSGVSAAERGTRVTVRGGAVLDCGGVAFHVRGGSLMHVSSGVLVGGNALGSHCADSGGRILTADTPAAKTARDHGL